MLTDSSFFPELTRDPGCIKRLASGNWTVHTCVVALNETRTWPSTLKNMFTRSTFIGRQRAGMKVVEGTDNWTETDYHKRKPPPRPVTNFKPSQFRVQKDVKQKEDVFISTLSLNVQQFPTGNEAGVITRAIELVRQNPALDRKLSEIGTLISSQNIIAPAYRLAEDKVSLTRWNAIAAQYSSKDFGDRV
jgi:hypothetical protein